MGIERRDLLLGLGGLTASAAMGRLAAGGVGGPSKSLVGLRQASEFPRQEDFSIEEGFTYLNAAYTHPIPRVAAAAACQSAEGRATLRAPASAVGTASNPADGPSQPTAKALFAQLINARPEEIAYVSSTSAGENLVVQALGLDRNFSGNVVTDALHFEGALLHLLELQKQGLELRIVRPNAEFRIDLNDLDRAIDRNTRLVELSTVSMYNGFQHDVKAVCELAHSRGALVYADAIHSAGAEPFDVKACGVDFAACSTFKWLMGDFGLGFLYVSDRVWDRIRRPVFGYYQAPNLQPIFPPYAPDGEYSPVIYDLDRSAAGMFESGTLVGRPAINLAMITASLQYILGLGVQQIQAHRQPLIRKLQEEVPRLGFTPVTPADSTAGIVTFARKDVGRSELAGKLQVGKVNVRLAANWLRVSPSVYNDLADVERLLEVMA